MIKSKTINSIEKLIKEVKRDYKEWQTDTFPWFRGETTKTDYPLLPKLYRSSKGQPPHDENRLLQNFRIKAPTFSQLPTPPKNHTDEWLFLAQHVGLPTRLLDWTEGLLFALHFALLEKEPVVWMLDPVALNRKSADSVDLDGKSFPLTWFSPDLAPITEKDLRRAVNTILGEMQDLATSERKEWKLTKLTDRPANIGNINIRAAWENKKDLGTELPVAVLPTYVHSRMNAQRSCFTIHGKSKTSLSDLVDERVLRKYVISPRSAANMRNDLRTIGITHATVFPDLDNLARDLSNLY